MNGGEIARGNLPGMSCFVGCQNEQSADQEMEPLAEVSRFLFSGKRGSRLAVRELLCGSGVKDEEQGDLSTSLKMTVGMLKAGEISPLRSR